MNPLVQPPVPTMGIFQRHIQQDPGICNNCFRRLFFEHEVNYTVAVKDDEAYPVKLRKSLENVVKPIRDKREVTEIPKEPCARGMGTVCECGLPFGEDTNRPISDPERLNDMIRRLSKRLDEAGFQHSNEKLAKKINRKWNEPQYQQRDDILFGDAIVTVLIGRNQKSKRATTS